MDETEGIIVVRRAASDWVYAVRFGSYVKIGSTTDPAGRLRGLPGSILKPDDLDMTDVEPLCAVPGNAETERLLHLMWAPFRAIGEWFHATDHIVETCRAANTDGQRETRFGLQDQTLMRDVVNF
jgi:hypothetical protein